MPPTDPYLLRANLTAFTGVEVQLAEASIKANKDASPFEMDALGFSLDDGATSTSWADVASATTPYPVPSAWLSAVADNTVAGTNWMTLDNNILLNSPTPLTKYAQISTTNSNFATFIQFECPLNNGSDPNNVGSATYSSRSLIINEYKETTFALLKRLTLTEDFFQFNNVYTAGTTNNVFIRSNVPEMTFSSVSSLTGPTFTTLLDIDPYDGWSQIKTDAGGAYSLGSDLGSRKIRSFTSFQNPSASQSYSKSFVVETLDNVSAPSSLALTHSNPVSTDSASISGNVKSTASQIAEFIIESTSIANGWDNSIKMTAYSQPDAVVKPQIRMTDGASPVTLSIDSLSKSDGDFSIGVDTAHTLKLDVPAGADLEIGAGALSEVISGGFEGKYLRIKIGVVFYKISLESDTA